MLKNGQAYFKNVAVWKTANKTTTQTNKEEIKKIKKIINENIIFENIKISTKGNSNIFPFNFETKTGNWILLKLGLVPRLMGKAIVPM